MDEMTRKAFRALGDPTRLHIVEFLASRCCSRASIDDTGGIEGPTAGEVCCHLTGADKINSTISQHLKELQSAGVISVERRGKFMQCSLNTESLRSLSAYLIDLAEASAGKTCC